MTFKCSTLNSAAEIRGYKEKVALSGAEYGWRIDGYRKSVGVEVRLMLFNAATNAFTR